MNITFSLSGKTSKNNKAKDATFIISVYHQYMGDNINSCKPLYINRVGNFIRDKGRGASDNRTSRSEIITHEYGK